jgi:uncharacterized hydrophobic protein (TIGR00271 family)
MTAEPRTRPGWARVAILRGGIGLVAGLIALFRPDDAALVLGAALVAVSLLELTIGVSTGDPEADVRRRGRRLLRVGAGIVAGLALIASAQGGAVTEIRIVAIALAVVAIADVWGARHATAPGVRGLRMARAAVTMAAAVVVFTIPGVAYTIVVFVAAVGWIAIGLIALGSVLWPSADADLAGRPPTGTVEIVDRWLRTRDVGDERRDEILEAYDYDLGDRDKLARFAILLTLASIIACAGLIANSVASIIGAMIIAPLMGPIVGIALGIVVGLPVRALRSLMVAVAGIALTIGVGVALGAWLGSAPSVPFNSEIVGRTSPSLIDLVVALAAGAAGAYATSNAKVADSLPGVAIAISLVPPLGTVGILLSHGDYASASGAMLLFLTNFVSIVLAASVVFVLVGVVPITSLAKNAERTQGWFVSFAVAGILLVIPLAVGGQQAFAAASDDLVATAAVEAWLAVDPAFQLVDVEVTGDTAKVSVAGPGTPPDPAVLQANLDTALGRPVDLDLVVTQTVLHTTPPRASPSPAS